MKIFGFPWTIRTRLSLLYAGAFFLAGLALIVFMYLFLGQVLEQQFTVGGAPGVPPLGPEELGPGPSVINIMIRRARTDTLQTMLIASSIIVAVLTIAAGLVGWLVAGQALHPLREITATARRVADRSLHERIALGGPRDEIKDLADTLDEMLERLDQSFDSQRRFVANASHELRTPLTIARTLIEVALLDDAINDKTRELGTTLLAINQRHEKLTDGLLTLASSEQAAGDFQRVDLADLVGHAIRELQPMAARAGVKLDVDVRPAPINADAYLIERLVQNLVENAIQYNLPQAGWVRVQVALNGDNVTLVVGNTGPVVPPHEIAGLFEPFRRLAGTDRIASFAPGASVRGAGLGLSIVRAVARSHGGDVDASPRHGGGLVVRVTFTPVA